MVPLTQVPAALRETVLEWRNTRAASLLFTHRDTAILAVVALIGLCFTILVGRALTRKKAGRTQVALPAVLDWSGGSWTALVRHGALLLFLGGLPFFTLALADPYSSLTREDVSFPGRRIALMIDASSSMMARFPAAHLNAKAPNEATFFTTVAAAETFIRQRMKGKYHDLIGLVEFGDEAYVVTPFTTDYDNILLSLSLIGDWTEFMKFPDQGTTIGLAIEQSVDLFKAFNFLDAAGNLMLIFSDGQDTQVMIHGKSVNEILAGAVATKIPVYFIRTSYNKSLGAVLPDDIWKPAVEATGGKFYPAGDEQTILNAIIDIDSRSAGRVEVKRYSTQRPKFAPYAFMATALWSLALVLQLTVPYFRKFP
ncbi:MAG TPA: vWA domain-containing protein [Vicinamibacterales bacterium]|nr:vWA domain-containing protein [Vicinamibacterales bacterium]